MPHGLWWSRADGVAEHDPTTRPEQAAVPPTFRRLPDHASPEQLEFARTEMSLAYATIAAAFNAEMPALRQAISALRAEAAADRVERRRLGADIEEVRNKVVLLEVDHGRLARRVTAIEMATAGFKRDHATTGRVTATEMRVAEQHSARLVAQDPSLTPVPAMREQFASSHDLTEQVSEVAAQAVVADLENKSTPPPGLEKIKALIAAPTLEAVDKVKAEERNAAEAERIATAAETRRQSNIQIAATAQAKTNTKYAIILAAVLAAIAVGKDVAERYFIRPAPAPMAPAPPNTQRAPPPAP